MQNELDQARRAAQQKQVVKESKAAPLAIFFQINKANITNKEMINLKGYADIIKNNPGKVYQVTGYADKATGTAAYNQKLSEKRAQNVADALVKKFGVNRPVSCRLSVKVAFPDLIAFTRERFN